MSLAAARIEQRLRDGDVVQVAALVMAVLVIALATVWPAPGQTSNESWYSFAQVRSVVLALLALGYGTSLVAEPPGRRGATAAVVVIVALAALPLEVAAYAASYPATPLWWSLVTVPVAAGGYLALGALLGRVTRTLRLGPLLPLFVPALLVGLLALDLRFGWTIANPLTAALAVSMPYLIAMGGAALLGAVALGVTAVRARARTEAP